MCILTKLFNLLLSRKYIPDRWKMHFTTLIPKTGKDLKLITNWRLITIGTERQRPFNASVLQPHKQILKDRESTSWRNLQSQGKGVSDFRNDVLGNAFLYDPALLTDGRFLDAIRLRTNTVGVNEALARAHVHDRKDCRQCKAPLETLGHVLGQCYVHTERRIWRHNKVVEILMKHFQYLGYETMLEPTLKYQDTTYKPDLILCKGNNRTIVDITVRFEDTGMVDRAIAEKEGKYQILSKYFQPYKVTGILSIVMGSRGAIPTHTKRIFRTYKVPKFLQKRMSFICLKSSIEIANAHLDY